MKILLIARVNQHSNAFSGVFKKILGQAEGFEASGCEVSLLVMSKARQILVDLRQGILMERYQWGPVPVENEKIIFWRNAKEAVHILNPDVIYARYDFMFDEPMLTTFFESIKHKNIVKCIEFPTYPYDDEIKDKKLLSRDKKNQEKLADSIDLIFSTSDVKSILGLPNHSFSNQVSRSFIESGCRSCAPLIDESGTIHLLSVASYAFWHGYDRLIHGMKNYYDAAVHYNVIYHVVGGGGQIAYLQQLTRQFGLEKYILFHGFQHGNNLLQYYEKASVGIASLGLHRINLHQSSTLKVREYLVNGLPIVASCYDEALANFKYVYKVDAGETPVNVSKLADFISEHNNKINIRSEIRHYAKQELSWKKHAVMVVGTIKKYKTS